MHPIAAFFSALCLSLVAFGAKSEPLRLSHDGVERLVWVEDGRRDPSQPAPLILAIHGYQTPEHAALEREDPSGLAWSDLQALALDAIILYPASLTGQWALFDGIAQTPNGRPLDDEGFLLDLVARYVESGQADPTRLHITGISDGAIMTYRLICLSETPFAAAAPLIGTAFEGHLDYCTPKTPPALMHVHGTDDRVLPYDGWIFRSGREVSVSEVTDHWRKLHGCTGQERQMLENIDPNDGSRVEEMTWTGCTRDGAVKLYKVIGGGHDVPALDATPREDDRLINRDLDTWGTMWAFFQANPRVE